MANPIRPGATNSYGKGGLSTTIQSRGMDIGPIPDFWGDLNQIRDRLGPVQRSIGGGQAEALRQPAPGYGPPPQAPGGIDAQLDYMQKRAQIIALDEAS
mgnify:FL=1